MYTIAGHSTPATTSVSVLACCEICMILESKINYSKDKIKGFRKAKFICSLSNDDMSKVYRQPSNQSFEAYFHLRWQN